MNTELTLDPQFNPQTEAEIKSAIREPWNEGKLMGQKPPLKLKEVWEIRIRLQLGKRLRELALFNLAIDSKLRGCDLVKLKVRDVARGDQISKRAMVMQQKTHQPVQFEITDKTRTSVLDLDQKCQTQELGESLFLRKLVLRTSCPNKRQKLNATANAFGRPSRSLRLRSRQALLPSFHTQQGVWNIGAQ